MSLRIHLEPIRPRNPLAVAARKRRAGVHRTSPGGMRQRAQASLRREIDRLRDTT